MQNVGIEGKLKELLKEIDEDIDTEMITCVSLLKEDVGLSSVAMLYMAVSIENEFGVDLSDANLKNMKTVEDVIQLISDRL